ncbi:SMI1/KNR4 family protein [Acinetobacter sp. AS167]|uniref:SMI1/KNR4 family protein n=1 Tax=Acinetobacter sp. AS167 TaxID=3127884 RepID=UPI00301B2B1E
MKIRRDNGKNSLDRINEVGRKIGYTFPRSYIDLIKEHDAVRLENNIFDFRNVYNKLDERDLNFLSFKTDRLDWFLF